MVAFFLSKAKYVNVSVLFFHMPYTDVGKSTTRECLCSSVVTLKFSHYDNADAPCGPSTLSLKTFTSIIGKSAIQ